MILPLENRESNDEMLDITWIQVFQRMLEMFREMLADDINISDEKINELVDEFMDAILTLLKLKVIRTLTTE